MILTIDVGNTQLLGGLFKEGELLLRFRKVTSLGTSSDELGLFLRSVIRENGYSPDEIRKIAICSVVPSINHSLGSACMKYFGIDPFFLRTGVKTGLKIKYNNPKDVGPDRIANAVAGTSLYPDTNLIIIDFGTATTIDTVSADRTYLGGAIAPGLKISMQALESRTARLPSVEILSPEKACGTSTIESIQSGLYFGHIGFVRELVSQIKEERFPGQELLVLGTGGFSSLFKKAGLFDKIIPDLVLLGIFRALEMNDHLGGRT